MWVAVIDSACRIEVFMYGGLQCLCIEGWQCALFW